LRTATQSGDVDPDAVRALLEALDARVRALERTRLSRQDRARLAMLLPAIAGCFGSRPFLASEVTTSTDAGLQCCCRGMSTKSLGKLFARADSWPVDGYVIEAVAGESGAWLWRVLRHVPDFLAPTKSGTV
jgi:hypothetical protein